MPRKPAPAPDQPDQPEQAEPGSGKTEHSFSDQFAATITREDLRKQFRSGRSYIWPPNGSDDEVRYYVSVTNALNALPKDALPRWAAKLVAHHAVENFPVLDEMIGRGDEDGAIRWLKGAPWAARDNAADTGTLVHHIAELFVLGEVEEAERITDTLDPAGKAKATQAMHFFREVPMRIDMTEAVVYSDKYSYAGTLDFLATIEDEELLKLWPGITMPPFPIILDLKTGGGVYDEVALQLAAYRFADHVVELESATLEPMPHTEGAGVLHVSEDGWELIPADVSEDTFRKFVRALALQVELPLSGLLGTPALRGAAK